MVTVAAVMLAAATVHGLLAGTDRHNVAVQWGAFVVLLPVVFLLTVRLAAPARPKRAVTAVPQQAEAA